MPLPVLCVIPARYAAQRFPGKPLALLAGKPIIQWVWESARQVADIDEVIIATDDERIREAAQSFGATVIMTPPECPSGSDRIACALGGRECRAIVNIQGDEPFMHPESVRRALAALLEDVGCAVATACIALTDRARFEDPMVVKVVRGAGDVALYFSRAAIPCPARRELPAAGSDAGVGAEIVWGHKHLGLYVYRPEALRAFVAMAPSALERMEKLEQLRFLEAGYRIRCVETPHDSPGIDTPADLKRAEAILRARTV